MSDLFTGDSLTSEYSQIKDSFWTCRAYALTSMASLMGGGHKSCRVEWTAEWATKPVFGNILRVIHDERVADAPPPPAVRIILDTPRVDSIIGVVGWLLGQAFKREFPVRMKLFERMAAWVILYGEAASTWSSSKHCGVISLGSRMPRQGSS